VTYRKLPLPRRVQHSHRADGGESHWATLSMARAAVLWRSAGKSFLLLTTGGLASISAASCQHQRRGFVGPPARRGSTTVGSTRRST
jgi:hypothetical protein